MCKHFIKIENLLSMLVAHSTPPLAKIVLKKKPYMFFSVMCDNDMSISVAQIIQCHKNIVKSVTVSITVLSFYSHKTFELQ